MIIKDGRQPKKRETQSTSGRLKLFPVLLGLKIAYTSDLQLTAFYTSASKRMYDVGLDTKLYGSRTKVCFLEFFAITLSSIGVINYFRFSAIYDLHFTLGVVNNVQ